MKPGAQASGAGVRLQLPAGWARGGASDLAGFERALWLRNSDENLRAAVAVLPAVSPTLLPAALPAEGTEPETVRLRSGYDVWRYRLDAPGRHRRRSSTRRRRRPGSPPSPASVRPTPARATRSRRPSSCRALAGSSSASAPRSSARCRRVGLAPRGRPRPRAGVRSPRRPARPRRRSPPTTSPRAQDRRRRARRRSARASSSPRRADRDGERVHGARERRARPHPAPYAKAGRDVAGADADLRRALSCDRLRPPTRPPSPARSDRRPRPRPSAKREPATVVAVPKKTVRRSRPDAPAAAALRRRRGLLRRAPGAPPVARSLSSARWPLPPRS